MADAALSARGPPDPDARDDDAHLRLHVLVGVVVLMAMAITAVGLLSDLTVRALDPRIQLEGTRAP